MSFAFASGHKILAEECQPSETGRPANTAATCLHSQQLGTANWYMCSAEIRGVVANPGGLFSGYFRWSSSVSRRSVTWLPNAWTAAIGQLSQQLLNLGKAWASEPDANDAHVVNIATGCSSTAIRTARQLIFISNRGVTIRERTLFAMMECCIPFTNIPSQCDNLINHGWDQNNLSWGLAGCLRLSCELGWMFLNPGWA